MINIDVIVRKAKLSDLPTIYKFVCKLEDEELEYDLFQLIFNENQLSSKNLYYVAEVESKVVKFISLQTQKLLHHCGTVGEIQEFYIDKEHRSKGIGKLLMNEVKSYVEANDIKSIEVTSNKARTENIKVYEGLGFKLTHNKFTL